MHHISAFFSAPEYTCVYVGAEQLAKGVGDKVQYFYILLFLLVLY